MKLFALQQVAWVIIGGSCELLSAPKCDFSHYKCTRKKKEATSLQPNVRLCAAWAESKKQKVWLKIRLQKIEDRDYVRVSSCLWMLLLVIYTSEMLTTWILLSGIEWVKLIFNYSQVWNVFTRWLFSVDSFRTETMTPWDDTFIKSVINVNIADLLSRSKKIWDKI